MTERELDVALAWENLEKAVDMVELEQGDWNLNLDTVTAGIIILYDFSPEEIIQQVEASRLPTKPTVSWLVYEGSRLPEAVPISKVRGLVGEWQRTRPDEPLIAGPGTPDGPKPAQKC